jgi:hypothetical protein
MAGLLSLFLSASWTSPPLPRFSRNMKALGIQVAHASLVHVANRAGIELIFTPDRHDFGVLRLAHGKKFRLIP